jgi:hypothetical protein
MIQTQVAAAGDIPLAGPNNAGTPCDGISLGLRFSGMPVGAIQIPPAGPDLCNTTKACPSTAAIDASAYPYTSPMKTMGACTQADLSQLISYLQANPSATIQQLRTQLQNAVCRMCAFGQETDATWAPFTASPGTPGGYYYDYGGCIELATNNAQCGHTYQQLARCALEACAGCAPADATGCQQMAGAGACSAIANAAVAACGGPSALTSAQNMCRGTMSSFPFEVPMQLSCITGGTFP